MRQIDVLSIPGQGTLGWYRARLGHFTGSTIGKLMVMPKRGIGFGETAKKHIIKVMSERYLDDFMVNDDEYFDEYLHQIKVESKAMRWGQEIEHVAREKYEVTRGVEVIECGSIDHPDILMYSASPDGLIPSEDKIIEIKSPNPDTAFMYQCFIKDNYSLKKVNDEYYWQIQSELDCTDAASCDLIIYSHFSQHQLYVVNITRNDEDIEKIHQRINEAEIWARKYLRLDFYDEEHERIMNLSPLNNLPDGNAKQ